MSTPHASADLPGYAELHCLSNFSFQRGASSALELFQRARKLGYTALAITDECSLAGIVRAYEAAQETGLALIVGSEVQLADGPKLVLLATDQDGYAELCRLITLGRRRSAKGEYRLTCADLETLGSGVLLLWPPAAEAARADAHGAWLARHFAARAWLAVELHRGPDDAARLAALRALGARHGLPLVASGDVHMHQRRRRALQDVLTAIRLRCTVAQAGHALFPNGERHLRPREALAALYPRELLEESGRIAARCRFDLGQLRYEYPHELVPAGSSASAHLRALTLAGAATRWPAGVPAAVQRQLEHELALIAELRYEHFFLTVHDLVAWARRQQPPILCQGRGSSANSAVCYCLGITAVDPEHGNLLFERFLSRERKEPPDIDVDFEHERREEVIQYVYAKYGRARAALAATVISYRGKSAARDVGRALGYSDDQLEQLSRVYSRFGAASLGERLRERGFDPASPALRQFLVLVRELLGFPRHLSQHVGGFVIAEQPLHTLVPVENAAMPERSVIQWDKDDLETLGLLKVDCLALGMLTCLRKCFDLLRAHGGPDLELAQVLQRHDEATYAMISRADTVGVFQIESRAQMSMLSRLKPRTFYDLVIEVAIVRPGPIQGGMVHPYLRRRQGLEQPEYPKPEIAQVLSRTLGVPIFQEQVMRLVEVAAGFTPGEADQLRRAMAAWKRRGGLEPFRDKILTQMAANGYRAEYAERIFEQIKGFGEYGFPESHAASFALLAYASAWLKCHHPAAFTAALLNAQPMGFYQPAQLVQDLQRHGVIVRPVDVTASDWDCTLERERDGALALRLGLRQVRGLGEELARRIVAARRAAPLRDVADLARRARVTAPERARLADAGALRRLSGHRHRARWDGAGAELPAPVLDAARLTEQRVTLRPPSRRDEVLTDYRTQGLSLRDHPVALVRATLARRRMLRARDALRQAGRALRYAGLVTTRQHPQTAKGVTFLTLEDETGQVNVIVWRALAERQPRELVEAVLLGVDGVLEESDGVQHLIAHRLHDLTHLLPELAFHSRDFH
jgi:error-prone DNA polymerase